MNENIWVFNGEGSRFASAVFDSRDKAEKWIFDNSLSGILTSYPLNTGVYEWAIQNNFFAPNKKEHSDPAFIGKFSSASQEHYHYTNGTRG